MFYNFIGILSEGYNNLYISSFILMTTYWVKFYVKLAFYNCVDLMTNLSYHDVCLKIILY